MTPDKMVSMFESLVADSLDQELEYNLLNEVKDTLEEDDVWAILKAVDVLQTANPADTYLTMKTLPADFASPAPRGIFVGTDIIPYSQIPFESRIRWQSATHRYYIDFGGNQYALCGGANPGGTIQFFYQKYSPVLVSEGPNWIFPARFHKVIPYLMAIKYFAVDQGDKGRAYDDRWDIHSKAILETMRRWNYKLRKTAVQNDSMSFDTSSYPDVADMDSEGGGAIYA